MSNDDFKKLVAFLEKEGQQGAPLKFQTGITTSDSIIIVTKDKLNNEIRLEISDMNCPFVARISRTVTF